jgi:triosephosphate isomerase (TIM)
MSKYYLILNWKMNLGINNSKKLGGLIATELRNQQIWDKVNLIICPTYPAILPVKEVLGNFGVRLGAQDVFWAKNGAYTGEVSATTLKELGIKYVIIGHSERRAYLKESDEMINKKVKSALENDLVPIICVGETFDERREGLKDFIISRQVTSALNEVKLSPDQEIIFAYEPVWVIGSGQAVSTVEAEHTHLVIRQLLFDIADANNWPSGQELARKVKIIYGGSVNDENINDFLDCPTIEGVLVGSASVDAGKILSLIRSIKSHG